MAIDVEEHLSAVERTVSSLLRDGQEARAVRLARTYPTTLADLWNATTTAERIPRWFAPVSGDLALGGRYQVEGNAGGLIEVCEPESRFAISWEFGGDVSWVEVALARDAGGVRLALTHTAHLSPHWDEYGPGAVGVGWEMGFLGLALHLAAPDEPTKPDEAEFAASAEGRAFIGGSAAGWGRAAIENGEDAKDAQAAAERTRAFFTGDSA